MVDHGWFPRLLRDGLRMTNRDSRILWGCRRFASGAPYLFVLLCLIFLFLELVALWAELPELSWIFCLLVLCSLSFLSRGNGVGGGRCPPQGAPFWVLDF